MAYDLEPLTKEAVLACIVSAPGLKQPQILDILRGPLEYYVADSEEGVEPKIYAGDVIPRPHLDLVDALRQLRAERRVDYLPKGSAGGWRAL